MQEALSFIKALTGPAKFCCLVVASAALVSCYSWLPLQLGIEYLPAIIVFASMASLAIGFMSMTGQMLISRKNRKVLLPAIRLPKIFWQLVIATFIYFLAVFFGTLIFYPHGVDLGPAVDLRIAGAASFFMSAAAMGFTQWSGLKVRAIHAAS